MMQFPFDNFRSKLKYGSQTFTSVSKDNPQFKGYVANG